MEDFKLIIEQYEADVICVSESWERDHFTLDQLLNIENYRIISNVKQRDFRGGKPAIIVIEEKFTIQNICPDLITVPVGVEAVWSLLTSKVNNPRNLVQRIAVCAIYYRGPKSTSKDQLFDHLAEAFHF